MEEGAEMISQEIKTLYEKRAYENFIGIFKIDRIQNKGEIGGRPILRDYFTQKLEIDVMERHLEAGILAEIDRQAAHAAIDAKAHFRKNKRLRITKIKISIEQERTFATADPLIDGGDAFQLTVIIESVEERRKDV